MSELHAVDHIMITELKCNWNYTKDLPLQERFEKLIKEARDHYMVFYKDKQALNVIYALGLMYKEESEEKFQALAYYVKLKMRTEEWVQENLELTEEEIDERMDLLKKYHDFKIDEPEKKLLPDNWNELWNK